MNPSDWFMNQGRWIDPSTGIAYEWDTYRTPHRRTSTLRMVARVDGRVATVEMTFSDEEVLLYTEARCVAKAMDHAERRVRDRATARVPQENTAGVLRHLVKMAKAVAA